MQVTGIGGEFRVTGTLQLQGWITVYLFLVFIGKKVIPVFYVKRFRRCFLTIKQGGADCAVEMAVFTDNGFRPQEVAKMLDDGGVHGYAARQNERRRDAGIRNQRVDDVFSQALAKPVADLPDGITFLLRVNQIGFGKYGAARGDLRGIAVVAKRHGAERFNAFQIEPFGLLVEEAA